MPAIAQTQSATWKDDVRGWYIGVDRSLSDGCYMHREFERGSTMRVGFNLDRDFIVTIGNEAQLSLENGKLYPIEFQFGSRTPWTVEADVWEWRTGNKALQFLLPLNGSNTETFITELQKMPNVVVRYEGRQILNLSLSGTFAAMEETINCQVSMQESTSSNPDPFNAGSETASDPFRQLLEIVVTSQQVVWLLIEQLRLQFVTLSSSFASTARCLI